MRRSSIRLAPRNFSTIGSRGRENLVVAPLAREIEDRVDRHADFHRRRHSAVRIGGVAFAELRVLSGERDERGEVPARGIAHERDTLGIDSEFRGLFPLRTAPRRRTSCTASGYAFSAGLDRRCVTASVA